MVLSVRPCLMLAPKRLANVDNSLGAVTGAQMDLGEFGGDSAVADLDAIWVTALALAYLALSIVLGTVVYIHPF